jgi:iron complex outermembrane receptor protein
MVSVHGDLYNGQAGEEDYLGWPIDLTTTVAGQAKFAGGYALGRWERRFSDRSDIGLQCFFNQDRRSEVVGSGTLRTLDFDFQHRYTASSRHDLLWGAGFRLLWDDIREGIVRFDPASRRDTVHSAFLQDDISFAEGRGILTIGSKFQHNDYSGIEVQPSVRALWNPTPTSSLWAAVSRAVRTPTRSDQDMEFEFALPPVMGYPAVARMQPSRDFDSEVVVAYEAGYRHQLRRGLNVDVATFYSDYSRLLATDLAGSPAIVFRPQLRVLVPLHFENSTEAEIYGVEVAPQWRPVTRWKLSGSYTWLRIQSREGSELDFFGEQNSETRSPRHQFHVRSSIDLNSRLELDAAVYYLSESFRSQIPANVKTDMRLGWRLVDGAELSLTVQNLLDGRHLEFLSDDYVRSLEVGRAAFVQATWSF